MKPGMTILSAFLVLSTKSIQQLPLQIGMILEFLGTVSESHGCVETGPLVMIILEDSPVVSPLTM